jgi:hypothetical protein
LPNRIPLDPKLPKHFDQTSNEDRTKDQLDAWWDHPYGVTLDNGQIDVRCLNGGAWDRSTHFGQVDTYEEACELAERAQARYLKFRERPTLRMDGPPTLPTLVILAQRPDQDERIVKSFETPQEAGDYMREHYPE